MVGGQRYTSSLSEVKWKVAFGVDLGQPFTVQIDYGFDRKGGIYEASL